MDVLSQQIAALSQKIDALTQIVEELNQRLTQALGHNALTPLPELAAIAAPSPHDPEDEWIGYVTAPTPALRPSLEHKDVLMDEDHTTSRSYSGERYITNEVQVQRLTAQLTAAYNQIAALEERLLAHHSHV